MPRNSRHFEPRPRQPPADESVPGSSIASARLGLPLAATIALVTFITAYVPYLGAIFSGAFAFLIALGSGGADEAFLVLVVVLVAQNVVQTVVQTKLTSDRLRIHPMVNFASTIVGASLAGIVGATLSAPAVAIVMRSAGRLRVLRANRDHGRCP